MLMDVNGFINQQTSQGLTLYLFNGFQHVYTWCSPEMMLGRCPVDGSPESPESTGIEGKFW